MSVLKYKNKQTGEREEVQVGGGSGGTGADGEMLQGMMNAGNVLGIGSTNHPLGSRGGITLDNLKVTDAAGAYAAWGGHLPAIIPNASHTGFMVSEGIRGHRLCPNKLKRRGSYGKKNLSFTIQPDG